MMSEQNSPNIEPTRSRGWRPDAPIWIAVFVFVGLVLFLLLGNLRSAPGSGRSDGFLFLFVPLMSLAAICRGGKWHWRVVEDSTALSAVCWFGWFTFLICGILKLCGV
jgi:hypothetical protein